MTSISTSIYGSSYRSSVTPADGLTLAAHRYTEINPQRPRILAIHGYPDNHHVWDAVAEELCERYRGRFMVAYNTTKAAVLGFSESLRRR